MQPINPNPQSNPQANNGGINPNDPNNYPNQPQYDQYGQPIVNPNYQYQQQPADFYQGQQGAQPGYSNAPTTGFDPYSPNISHLDYNATMNQGQPNYDPYQPNSQPATSGYNEPLMANEIPGVNPTFQDKKRGNNLFIIIAAVVAVILTVVLTILIFLNLNRPATPNQSDTAVSSQASSIESVASSIQDIIISSSSLSSSAGIVISRPTSVSSSASLSTSLISSSRVSLIESSSSAANSVRSVSSVASSVVNNDAPVVVF